MAQQTCVVVGGGLAGTTAAFALRSGGYDGRIVLVCEEARHPYSKPELSKGILRGELPDERTRLRPDDWYARHEIDLILDRAALALDVDSRKVELADGEHVAWDHVLLATGGRPRTLPGTQGVRGVYTLRSLDDSHEIRQRLGPGRSLLVVGGGFIGAEVAASARALGTDVTVLEAAPAPLSRLLPPALTEFYARLHRANGVNMVLGAGVDHVRADGDGIVATDVAGRTYRTDALVVAIGTVPNTELAAGAGLAIDDGVVVDEYCRTSAPGIFAAGDVANHPNRLLGRRIRVEHWQTAQHHGAAAAKNILGKEHAFSEVPWVWSDQYDVNLQIAGVPDPGDDVILRGAVDSSRFSAFLLRDGVLVAAIGVNRADDVRVGRQLIAQAARPDPRALGDESVELADLMSLAEADG